MNDRAAFRIEIGSLELGDIPVERADAIRLTVESELARLLKTRGWPRRDTASAQIRGVRFDPAKAPVESGRELARAIYEELSR